MAEPGNREVKAGACSWAEATLVKESDWYPKRSMKAAERMAYYASRLPLVEIDSTYRFPPTPDVARQWVERTPDGFTIDVRAWSLLAGQATMPASLWEDLHGEVRPEARDSRLPDYRLVVEFGNPKWLGGDQCEDTLEMLEEVGVGVACVDFTEYPVVTAATTDLAMVRFHGRHADPELEPGIRAGWRFAHRYTTDELAEWVPRIRELADTATEVHLVMNNGWRDNAVANAEELVGLL